MITICDLIAPLCLPNDGNSHAARRVFPRVETDQTSTKKHRSLTIKVNWDGINTMPQSRSKAYIDWISLAFKQLSELWNHQTYQWQKKGGWGTGYPIAKKNACNVDYFFTLEALGCSYSNFFPPLHYNALRHFFMMIKALKNKRVVWTLRISQKILFSEVFSLWLPI